MRPLQIIFQSAAILILGCLTGCHTLMHNALFLNPDWTEVASNMASRSSVPVETVTPAQGSREIIYVPANINGKSARLALDTGSPMLLLWNDRAARFDVKDSTISATIHLAVWGREAYVNGLVSSTKSDDDHLDGILPLSYFRKDVVQIDAANHEAHLLKDVPAEARSWVKFPLRNDLPDLAFTVPLPNGKKSLVYIDTGAPFGIFIPTNSWQGWKADNPLAPVTIVAFSQATTGMASVEEEAWAAHFSIGSLQLADVPVTEMPAKIERPGPLLELASVVLFQTNLYALMPARDATLGMSALNQLDMIVDGPDGIIYIKAKDTPLAPYDHNRLGAVFVPNDLLNAGADEPLRARVAPGSPAAEAGIQDGDILLDLDGYQGPYNGETAMKKINSTFYEPAGTKIGLKVKRGSQTLAVTTTLRNILGPDQSTALSYVRRSRSEIDQKDYDATIADDSLALKLDPQFVLAYDVRSDCKNLKGDYDGAIADATKAIELDPEDATAYDHRSYAKKYKGDYDGAVADESKAIDIEPNDATGYENRGQAKRAKGDYDGAIADYTKAIEINPKEASAYEFRGNVKQIQGDFTGALAQYNQAIEVSPDDALYTHLYRQFLLIRAGTAPDDLAATVAKWKDGWPKPLGLFVAGELDETGLLGAAGKGGMEPVDKQKCEAYYDIGMMHLLKGDQAAARDSFQKSMAIGANVYDEYNLAQAELARLDAMAKK